MAKTKRKTPTVTLDEAAAPASPAFRCPWLLLCLEKAKPSQALGRWVERLRKSLQEDNIAH